jgi:uncharacterized tellurite resistance protein B-like protein
MVMFRALKDFLDEIVPEAGPSNGREAPSLRLAAAVLLMEVMRASDGISAEERAAAARFLASEFQLSDEQMAPLLAHAQSESIAAYDFRFTDPLDNGLPQDRKIALVDAMWKVAYADGQLDPRENAVISKVADLLHVSHGDYIAGKMRAQPAR